MSGAITVTGQVLEVTHRAGTFTNDEGREMPYDFHLASVLVGKRIVEVKFPPDAADARPPKEGDSIAVEVELSKQTRPKALRYVGAKAA